MNQSASTRDRIDLTELEDAFRQVGAGGVIALSRFSVNIPFTVCGKACAFLPDRGQSFSRLDIEGAFLLQSGRVVGHDPTLTVVVAAIRAECDIYVAIGEEQARAIQFVKVLKSRGNAIQGVGGADGRRAAEYLLPGGYIESMQPMKHLSILIGFGNQINGARRGIDHRS